MEPRTATVMPWLRYAVDSLFADGRWKELKRVVRRCLTASRQPKQQCSDCYLHLICCNQLTYGYPAGMLNEPSVNRRSQSPPRMELGSFYYYSMVSINFATTRRINIAMIDLHNDALLELPKGKLLTYLRQAKISGVDEIWLSVWTTELKDPLAIITKKKALLNEINSDHAYPICHLHIEDAWFLTEDNINQLIALQPHSVGLTWNKANKLAGGAHSRGKITPWGYQVIKRLEAANIQIDTAHLNRRSFWQFTQVTTRPLVCTHTAFTAIHHHPRNLTKKQIHTIIKSGGMIGLALVPKFLTKNTTSCDIFDLIKHINYFNRHFDNHALHWGTDFYGTKQLPNHIKGYQDLHHLLKTQIIGYSILHQPIIAYQLGNPTAPRRLLITAGMHAREWISSLALQTWLNH